VENQVACSLKRDQTSHILQLPGSSGHPRCHQLWAKYTSNHLSGVWCDHCDWHGIEARVLMLFAWNARRPPVAEKLWATGGCCAAVYSLPFRWHQKTVLDIIITILHRFERKACWPTCLFDFVQLLLWIRSVLVSNAHVRRAFVHHIVRPRVTAWPRNVTGVGVRSPLLGLLSYLFPYCPCMGAADVNGSSRQPTSRQNRCSKVADDAGIVR